MKKEIKQTWFFKQPPEEVWDHLTKPELIEQWLMPNNFKPVEGHKFRFTFEAKKESKYAGVVNCEVQEIKPFTRLAYTWDGATNDGRNFNSEVVWTLIRKENGTELQLSHNGFTVLEDLLNHSSGWDNCLKRFEELISKSK
ncbi:MAG: SRPBCC family protein [Bacteroidia bacterium]